MRLIDLIVIHCSASPNGDSLFRGTPGAADFRTPAQTIDAWHKARGFRRAKLVAGAWNPTLGHIGYHHVIHLDGVVAAGRSHNEVGAHAKGHNADSIGICLVGTDRYTAKQWDGLRGLVVSLEAMYRGARVVGHRDLSPDLDGDGTVEPREWLKTCPGFSVADWLAGGRVALADHLLEETR